MSSNKTLKNHLVNVIRFQFTVLLICIVQVKALLAQELNACDLLTQEDAIQILGSDIGDPVSTGPNYCGYSNNAYQSVAVSIEDVKSLSDMTAQEIAEQLNEIQSNNSLTADFPPWQPLLLNGGSVAVTQDMEGVSSVRIIKNERSLLVVGPTPAQAAELAQTLISRLP